eukprot:TRINITY_DN30019_c0_g1_i1.p1 TRINITY_DN30019_c0_g1~~TRINITY_DN30019_c0_g1_i1.p1  ORF type:complete len:192 (+),score=19.74 TRINITY_DN30019_c0_g1_i1:111-686(+)
MAEPDDPCAVYVGGLSFDTNDDGLERAFAEFGTVASVKVIYDRETRQARGFGFVVFTTPRAADIARREMNGQILDGRQIRVTEVKRKEDRKPYGGGTAGYEGGGRGSYRDRYDDRDRDRDRGRDPRDRDYDRDRGRDYGDRGEGESRYGASRSRQRSYSPRDRSRSPEANPRRYAAPPPDDRRERPRREAR